LCIGSENNASSEIAVSFHNLQFAKFSGPYVLRWKGYTYGLGYQTCDWYYNEIIPLVEETRVYGHVEYDPYTHKYCISTYIVYLDADWHIGDPQVNAAFQTEWFDSPPDCLNSAYRNIPTLWVASGAIEGVSTSSVEF
jgi:hypothetical protein